MIRNHYFILGVDGEPVPEPDFMAWGRWYETARRGDRDLCRVDRTQVGDADVSTVFLATDHQFLDGPPLLYETMIFDGGWSDYQWRYSTRAEAQRGHDAIVAALRAGAHPSPTYPCEVSS